MQWKVNGALWYFTHALKTTKTENMRLLKSILWGVLFTLPALAETETTVAVTKDSAVRPWYRASYVQPELSVVHPFSLSSLSGGLEVLTTPSGTGFILPQMSLIYPLVGFDRLDISLGLKIGYTQKLVPVQGAGIDRVVTAPLHWIPVMGSARFMGHIPGFRFLRPAVSLGFGGQYFFQARENESPSRLVPCASISPALVFQDENSAEEWFGGFVFGATFSSAVFSNVEASYTSLDLSFIITL